MSSQSISIGEQETENLSHSLMVPGVSMAIAVLQNVLREIAATEIPILLLGESGSGKDVVAAEIHRLSPNCRHPLMKLSCSSMNPDSLLSCTRSDKSDQNGTFYPGTLLLDEVSDLSPEQQAYLLNLLPDTGKSNSKTLASRLISTSTKDLTHAIRNGSLREDLYFRLNGFCLRIPSLRQRKEDIPLLFATFVARDSKLFGRRQPDIENSTIDLLMQYSWPGNVRELENFARQVVLFGYEFAAGELVMNTRTRGVDKPSPAAATDSVSLKQAAREASRKAERSMIVASLERTHWNRKRTARELQISYKALLYKLKQLGLDDRRTPE